MTDDLPYDDWDGDFEWEPCQKCGGDGIAELQDCPEVWGEDCLAEVNRLITCPACGGTGDAADTDGCW